MVQRSQVKIGLNEQEEKRFYKALDKASERSKLLWLLILETGVRISEALSLDIGSVEGQEKIIVKIKGWTGNKKENTFKPRIRRKLIMLSYGLQKQIKAYIEERRTKETITPDMPLFLSREGGRLSVRQAEREFLQLLNDAGVNNPSYPAKGENGVTQMRHSITPHCLRHTVATWIVKRQGHKVAQRVLGHSAPSITLAFYTDVRDEDLEAVAENRRDFIEDKIS
jgi:integrase